jgi:glycerate-2-kinase
MKRNDWPDKNEIRSAITSWYRTALSAVDPHAATLSALSRTQDTIVVAGRTIALPTRGRVIGVALGKAAAPMARALAEVLGDRLTEGIALTKDGHLDGAPAGWRLFEAAHPVPDARGVCATRQITEVVSSLGRNDLVFVLVSGGGSALLESPRPPLALTDIQQVTDQLLRAGAPIQDLNAVRSELSEVKGGGLRRQMGEATCVSLILSDVLGNDPTVIASGPTVPRASNPDRAAELIEHYGVRDRVPPAIHQVLRDAGSMPVVRKPSDDVFAIVGDNAAFIRAVAAAAEGGGFASRVVLTDAEGEATSVADRFVDSIAHQPRDVDVVIGGGEATVTVRGNGVGGRNTEFALAAAIRLADEHDDWVVASLASDGQDGAIDAAGAIVDSATLERGRINGLSALTCLQLNDSGAYLQATGDLVVTGPTGTNVNDVYIAVRRRHERSAS